MAVDAAQKMWSRDSSDFEYVNGQRMKIAIREAYTVTHTSDATPIEIVNASGLPAANSLYPGTSYVYCKTASPERVSPIMSIVGVSYLGDGDIDEPEIRYTDVATEMPIDEDYDGNPIVTENGEPIDGITAEFADPKLIVKRKFLSFNQYLTSAYRRSTNSDTFNGWPPGTARLTQFEAVLVGSLYGVHHFDVTAEITFRVPWRTTAAKAWHARTRHEGFYVRDTVGGPLRRAYDSKGEPVVKPVLLDADGIEETNPANAIWLEFKRYGTLPYNALGLL